MATQWKPETFRPQSSLDVGSIIGLSRHAVSEAAEIIRSEANVIKLELEESTRAVIVDALKATLFSAIALLGLLSLLAFLIIGLADLIIGHLSSITSFWASALIIGVIFTAVGGLMAARHAKRIGADAQMKKIRNELKVDKAFIKDEWNSATSGTGRSHNGQ